jgi:hypothetical protein
MAMMGGTKAFTPHVMSLYQQIGYIYRQLGMHAAATDYFKKQLFTAWQKKSTE